MYIRPGTHQLDYPTRLAVVAFDRFSPALLLASEGYNFRLDIGCVFSILEYMTLLRRRIVIVDFFLSNVLSDPLL